MGGLFDPTSFEVSPTDGVDRDALSRFAFLYTASEKGNCSGIRFALTVPEARTWCESPVSGGASHGTQWRYLWTAVATFIDVFQSPVIDITGYEDSGEWDQRIADLGLSKIGFERFAEVFEPLGLTVIDSRSKALRFAGHHVPNTVAA